MAGMLIMIVAGLFIFFSPQVMDAASTAAAVFVKSVLPALFPMMILNGLSAGLPEKGARGRLARGAETILFSFASGSPASAQRLLVAQERTAFSKGGFYGLAAATGVMSPMFIVGSLSARMGIEKGAWIMLVAHWLSALLIGVSCLAVLPPGRLSNEAAIAPLPTRPMEKAPSLMALLPKAVSNAAQALLAVCGAMMLFSIVAAVLRTLLLLLFPTSLENQAAPMAIFWALLEVGGGCFAVLDAFPSPPLPLLCALCSFGGFSIWLQNLLFLGKAIRPERLLLLRCLHGAAAYGICWFLLWLWPESQTVLSTIGQSPFMAPVSPLPGLLLALLACYRPPLSP